MDKKDNCDLLLLLAIVVTDIDFVEAVLNTEIIVTDNNIKKLSNSFFPKYYGKGEVKLFYIFNNKFILF